MTITKKASLPRRAFALLQKMGKSLLFPIAMLPIAAIFLRVGDAIPGTTDFSEFMSKLFLAIGNSVFGWALPFIFAIGIAFGMTKDQRGEAAITGFAVMLVLSIMLSTAGPFGGFDFVDRVYGGMTLEGGHGFHGVMGDAYDGVLAKNVFIGIFAGSLVSYLYNRFNGVELPSVLGFFSGRRLIPVLSMMSTIFLGLVLALIFPWIGAGLYYIGKAMAEAKGNRWGNAGIMGGYGIINRLLIPFGLHHVINTPVWFTQLGGDLKGVQGDINIFGQVPASWIADGATQITKDSINTAGTFQSGFFPTMMFGLPAIAAAIWFNADGQKQKAKVASLFAGSALVSFFTGITEPIEFSFMFLAPALYGLHAILTGLFGFIVGLFGIQLGFGFSAGLVDYVLSLPKSIDIAAAKGTVFGSADGVMANPGWMWLIGAVAAATYFFSANFMIKKLNISTPGRGNNLLEEDDASTGGSTAVAAGSTARAAKYVKALGGYENITMYSHCATRLRYDIIDDSKVDDKALQSAGAFGVAHPSKTHVQVIVGPTVEILNNEILAGKPAGAKATVKTGVVAAKPAAKKPATTAAKKPVAKKATTTAKKPAAKTTAKKPAVKK